MSSQGVDRSGSLSWEPRFVIRPTTAGSLMRIEAAREAVLRSEMPAAAAEELRRAAQIRSTHFSTQIEGNRLTLAEAERAVGRRSALIAGRERDVREVQRYWVALLHVQEWAAARRPLNSELVRRIHGLVERGPRSRPTAYRDGQNAIRDGATGLLVYLPPVAADVGGLVEGLVAWCDRAGSSGVPVPVIAAMAHYQVATIHPFYDGNGRTARLVAMLLLHRGGYGFEGIYSLEEEHARDRSAYYAALATHPHHNYYEGRASADLTGWLDYFAASLAAVMDRAKVEALRADRGDPCPVPQAPPLDARARRVVALFTRHTVLVSRDVAVEFGISERAARMVLAGLCEAGVVMALDPSNRARKYGLSEVYRQFVGS